MSTGSWKRHSAEEAAMTPVAVVIANRSWDQIEKPTIARLRRNLDRLKRMGGNFEAMQLVSEMDDDLAVLEHGDPGEDARNEWLHRHLRKQVALAGSIQPRLVEA